MRATDSDRGGAGRKLLIALLVIVVILIALDRVGDAVAERYAADTIQSSQGLPKRPSVNITGFPFLTQLAAGDFGKIVLADDDVPIGSGSVDLRLSNITVTLHEVRVARNLSSVHAEVADAVATMNYADLGRALGNVHIHYAGRGRIVAADSIDVLGQHISGSISATPRLTNGALTFGAARVNNLGSIAAAAAATLQKIFDIQLPLNGVPFGVRVQSLHADKSGLHLGLVGRNLSYSR
jgi:hypothetical protein